MWHQWFNHNVMKLWEYFLYAKKTKITTLFNDFFSSVAVFNACSQQDHYACMCIPLHVNKAQSTWVLRQNAAYVVVLLWTCINWHGREEIVFFAHKKYSHSFITLWLNHWCHMDCFNDVLTTFLKVVVVLLSMQGQKAHGFHQKYINLCSKDE